MRPGPTPKGTIKRLADGRWLASIKITDRAGKRRTFKATTTGTTKREAAEILESVRARAAEAMSGVAPVAPPRTVADLMRRYAAERCKPAEYVGGRKVSGLRSTRGVAAQIRKIEAFFGRMTVETLSHGDLADFKESLLKNPKLKIATVNRTLQRLRAALNFAVRSSWIVRNPFTQGEPLIHVADEARRDRVLSRAEERALLDLCVGDRAIYRFLIVGLLDTGARLGEFIGAEWSQYDLVARTLTITSHKGRTARTRTVGLTERLHAELMLRQSVAPESRPFPYQSPKRVWASLCRAAGLQDVRLNDLRHTAATRLEAAISERQTANILGHAPGSRITARYVNLDEEARRAAIAALDKFNGETEAEEFARELPS